MEWGGLGKSLIIIGLGICAVGLLIVLAGRWLGTGPVAWLGRLPGDLLIKRDNVVFYFPLATSVLISVVLTVVLTVVLLLFRR